MKRKRNDSPNMMCYFLFVVRQRISIDGLSPSLLKNFPAFFLLAWFLLAPPAFAQEDRETGQDDRFDGPLLPFYNHQLTLASARYFTANPDFDWLGQIASEWETTWRGALSPYFLLQIDMVAGHTARSFDLNQASFILEPGIRYPIPRGTIELAYHHLSRHTFDRSPGATKLGAWDTPTVLIEQSVPVSFGKIRGYLAAGDAINKGGGVDYNWEGRGKFMAEVQVGPASSLFLSQESRYMRLDAPRSDGKSFFWDTSAEAGLRLLGREWDMVFFAQHQHKNDVDRARGKSETWNLIGIRLQR